MLTVSELWLSTKDSDWKTALNRYWDYIDPVNLDVEGVFDELDADRIKGMDAGAWYAFLHDRYFKWKFTQKNVCTANRKTLRAHVEENGLSHLYDVHGNLFSFDRQDIVRGLAIACEIPGLAVRGASGLLAVLFPSEFATVDIFLLQALQRIETLSGDVTLTSMKSSTMNINKGAYLIQIMRDKSADLNKIFRTNFWTPRRLDMIFWQYGR